MRSFHPSAIVGTLALYGLGGAAALAAFGCGDAVSMFGPASGCSIDAGCGPGSSGGGVVPDGGVTSTGTGTGGSAAEGELQGDVEPFADATFETLTGTAMTGAAQIVVQPSSGPQLTTPYGGSSGPSFDVMNVPNGTAWVYVKDESNGANGIWPTLTALSVPQITAVHLPVVLQSTFAYLAGSLPSVASKGVSTQAAHLVILLQYQGQPFSGVQVTSGSNGAMVVYDVGPGVYSDTAKATGSGGTILLFNAGGSGMQTISVTSSLLTKSYALPVFTAAGAVTVAGFDLQ